MISWTSLPGSPVHGDTSGKNTGVGCHALLQGIFPIQGSNPGFLHCRQILYHLSHQGSPRILESAAYPFSRGTSLPRNWSGVSYIAGGFSTSWATREAPRNTLYKIDKNKILLYSTRTYIQYVLHCLPEFAQIHIHWVRDVFNNCILCQPLLVLPSIFPSISLFQRHFTLGG